MTEIIKFYEKCLPNIKHAFSDEYKANCPFHKDDTPSLFINAKTGLYYCFGCGASGGIKSFHLHFGITYQDSLYQIEDKKIEETRFIKYIQPEIIQEFHHNLLNNSEKLEYVLRKRFISYFIIKRFLIGYDIESNRFTFPIKNRSGKFINIKFHRSNAEPKSYSWGKGYGTPRLFPISALNKREIIICEGEFDCLLLHSYGFNAISSTGGVKSFKDSWIEFFRSKQVKILFDIDMAGNEAGLRLGERFRDSNINSFKVTFPNDFTGKDVTDFASDGGDLYKLLGKIKR